MQYFGENGLIAKADRAKDWHEQGKQQEDVELRNYTDYIGSYLNGYSGGNTGGETPEMPETWDNTKVTVIDDGKGNPVPLPNGYHHVGGNIDTGIVISDKKGDTIDASGINMGNQFVWIPVVSEADLERTDFDSATGKPMAGLSASFTEPYAKGFPTEAEEYNTMRTQVLKYGGFYIGRFEAGINSTTLRTGTTTAQTVVSKRGVAPYNYVPWGKAMNDAGEIEGKSGAVYLARNQLEHPDSVTSTLCYGCQWDAMCRYIGDSNRRTLGKTEPELTGSVPEDVSKNIYDLAGNCQEWTMEAIEKTHRTGRGGFYYDVGLVLTRFNYFPTDNISGCSFRVAFYIN